MIIKLLFKEENKNESRSVSETGDGVEDADGSSQMSAEFVYQNGSYQLRSVNPEISGISSYSRFIPKKFFQKMQII